VRGFCSLLIALSCIMAAGQRPTAATAKKLVAHRGASAYAPEHTLASYRLAMQQKADYVEQDLAVTKDLVLICLHDESLERTTNVEDVFPDRAVVDPATGRKQWLAVDFTLSEIKRLDAGSWFDARFAGERIPTWGGSRCDRGHGGRTLPRAQDAGALSRTRHRPDGVVRGLVHAIEPARTSGRITHRAVLRRTAAHGSDTAAARIAAHVSDRHP
jgi:hypothetical protein